MNRTLILLIFHSFFQILRASELEFQTAYLPLYVAHGVVGEGTESVHSNPRIVNFVSRGAQPETHLSFLMSAYIPHHDTTWDKVGDANLITLCGINLSHKSTKLESGGYRLDITIDTSSFKLPDNVRLPREEVVDLVRRAVALNYPHAAITIKDGEQDGTGQPATRPESKSEGSDKPQPEAEGRPR
jgi:hypothetical protein